MPRRQVVVIRWSDEARRDAAEIARYISIDNPAAARKVVRIIQARISGLREYPLKGRVGRRLGTRELIIRRAPYVVIYSVEGFVLIEHVLHTSQQWPPEDE